MLRAEGLPSRESHGVPVTQSTELNSSGGPNAFSKSNNAQSGLFRTSELSPVLGTKTTRQWNESPRQAEIRLRKAIAGLHTPSPPHAQPSKPHSPRPPRPHSAALPRVHAATANDLQDELGMTRDVLTAAQHHLIEARRSASVARQSEERALAAVLKTRDEARQQVMQACDEAKQQIMSAQVRA